MAGLSHLQSEVLSYWSCLIAEDLIWVHPCGFSCRGICLDCTLPAKQVGLIQTPGPFLCMRFNELHAEQQLRSDVLICPDHTGQILVGWSQRWDHFFRREVHKAEEFRSCSHEHLFACKPTGPFKQLKTFRLQMCTVISTVGDGG